MFRTKPTPNEIELIILNNKFDLLDGYIKQYGLPHNKYVAKAISKRSNQTIEFLLHSGLKANSQWLSKCMACTNIEAARMFIAHGANPNILVEDMDEFYEMIEYHKCDDRYWPEVIPFLVEYFEQVIRQDNTTRHYMGQMLFVLLCEKHHDQDFIIKTANLLLRAGADINYQDPESEESYLHQVVKFPKRLKVIKLLITAGINVNQIDEKGKTTIDNLTSTAIRISGDELSNYMKTIMLAGANLRLCKSTPVIKLEIDRRIRVFTTMQRISKRSKYTQVPKEIWNIIYSYLKIAEGIPLHIQPPAESQFCQCKGH